MEPTLHEGDVVLISSLPYLFKNPKVGDVIILKRQKYIIKRITKEDRGKFAGSWLAHERLDNRRIVRVPKSGLLKPDQQKLVERRKGQLGTVLLARREDEPYVLEVL